MTDMTKYKNLSLSMETYKDRGNRKSMVQGGDVSRAKAVTILVNLAYEKLQQKLSKKFCLVRRLHGIKFNYLNLNFSYSCSCGLFSF